MLITNFRLHVVLGLLGVACSNGDSVAGNNNTAPLPPPSPPAASDLILHTTLDGPNAVMAVAVGTSAGAIIETSPPNDFVSARFGQGLRTNAVGERILYRQTDGGTPNIELEQGTIEFWYKPNYNHNNSRKYTIFGTGNWGGSPEGRGSLHFGKHNNSNQNMIFLIFFDANRVRWEHDVDVSDYRWSAGDWIQFRITWNFNVAPGVQNLHLYMNGAELPLKGQVSRGPQILPAERSDELIYIGSRDTIGSIIADGDYDEVRIWKRAIPPS